ncbi:MAG TPA: N-acyl homoserine lactonase family protein [Dehalococcoidia bacterium]|nr:N-acyl homoserine lactonase family protein [Dehalococcoidia bacterium]
MGTTLRGLNLGYMGMDMGVMVYPHANYALMAGGQRAGALTWYQCPAQSYIIDHPDGRILWETGISTNWKAEWLPGWQYLVDLSAITPEMCLEARLKSVGMAPEDFKYVIQGHLHTDHAGGLRLFEDAGATIVCHEDEYKFVRGIETADAFFVRADWDFLGYKAPVTTYGDQQILKGVWLISLPGHTPGTMGLLMKLDHTGWVLLTSDALYTHDSYGPPATGSPIVWNAELWARSVARLRRIATEHDAFVFPGHDETGIQHEKGTTSFKRIEYLPGHAYE